MLKNYFRIAFRNMAQNKVYSLINICGLATGLAVTLVIGLWVQGELSFNKSIANYDRVGEIWQFVSFDIEKSAFNVMPVPLREDLGKNYPEVKLTSLSKENVAVLAKGDNKFSVTGQYVEPEYTEIMSLKMKSGNRAGLKDMHSILLSSRMARQLFGEKDGLNELIRLNDTSLVKVAGIFEDFPQNNRFKETTFLAPWSLLEATDAGARYSRTAIDDNNYMVFVLLNKGADFAALSEKIRDIRMKKENPPSYKPEFFVHPMSKWHLYGEFTNGVNTGGMISYVWLFGIIGVIVLLLACINFMNLSTARSVKRAKEVGIRKTIGSMRFQLIRQFFVESGVYVFMATLFALLLVALSLPFFNHLSGKLMNIPWTNFYFWMAIIGFGIFTTFVAGSYPAFYLSGLVPIKVLKGNMKVGRLASLPRRALVVLQFTVSVFMIIGTIVVFRQVQYVRDRPSGYSRAGLLEIKVTNNTLRNHFNALYTDLKATGAVESMATSSCPITMQYGGTTDISWATKTPDQHPLVMSNAVSQDFGKTVSWKVKTGRDFSRTFITDSSAMILNASAATLMGFKDPLGQLVRARGRQYQVIGVTDDLIRASPFEKVHPTFYTMNANDASVIDIKLNAKVGASMAVDKIKQIVERYDPSTPFVYQFVNDQYAAKFNNEQRIGNLAAVFAALAIFISCLGLFGLASFVAEQRNKEIGIRKALGASIQQMWRLLSGEFIMLVGISLIIAAPLAYMAMHKWLAGYEFRTEISWWIFAAVAAGTIVITLCTVSFQAIKVALANPTRTLRTE